MKTFQTIVVLFFIQQQVLGKYINPCSKTTEVTPLKDFDIEKLKGKIWYDIKYGDTLSMDVIHNLTDPEQSSCPSMNISATSVPNVYRATYTFINLTDHEYYSYDNVNFEAESEYPAVFHYGKNGTTYEDTNIVVGTDYETWLLTYGCFEYDGKTEQFATIRGNKRTMEKSLLDEVSINLEKLGFSKEKISLAGHKGC